MATTKPITAQLGKSTLSMYLRTNCDKELYLSLFKSNGEAALVAAGTPAPLSARPNIELVTTAGVEFEAHELGMLISVVGLTHSHFKKDAKGGFVETDLAAALGTGVVPLFCLQPALDPNAFKKSLLLNDFGLTNADESLIPKLSGLRPDLVIARDRNGLRWEVLPSGKRKLLAGSDTRVALSVVDIKNTIEGNKSYAAEVVLYSIFLAKWLATTGLSATHFVSDECFLWTHNEKEAFDSLPPTATIDAKLAALLTVLEKVEFAAIAPSVVKFFKEDVPRVMAAAASGTWQSLDYHVGPRCSNCDWLGFDKWLSSSDRALLAANPAWYCKPNASACQHLSQIPSISRGARQILEANGVKTITDLKTLPTTSPTLSLHSALKRERSQLSHRADAILTNVSSTDSSAALAGLAKDVELELAISVNFDSAAGLLTGLACRATLFMPFGSTPPVVRLVDFAAPVENQDAKSEWDVLFAFLAAIEGVVRQAEKKLGGKSPRTQIYVWEQRQFQELCAAVGRHLPKIFSPAVKAPKGSLIQALAWLFPPEDLIERESAVSPHIVFLGDIAQRVLRVPNPHAFTLLATHEAYHLPSLPPRHLDSYFRDPLGNGIPRERIFEVWKNKGTIRRGGVVVTKAQASSDYLNALKVHTLAVASIAARLRQDFKHSLKGSVKQFKPSTFKGATGVAFDSKLWIQWGAVESATARAERISEFTLTAESLEATYKAVVLDTLLSTQSSRRALYSVRPDSRDAKVDDNGEYFAIGSVGKPGLPLETPASLGLPFDLKYLKTGWGGKQINTHQMPLYSVVRGKIHSFNRDALEADVELLPRKNIFDDVVDDLISGGHLPVAGGMFLMDGAPYDDSAKTDSILKAIGSPSFASPDPSALRAMGVTGVASSGATPSTPAASVLWNPVALSTTAVRTPSQAQSLASRAKALLSGKLDPSQQDAIEQLSQQQVSLVWGPPGTGKTSTLTAYLLAVAEEANSQGKPKKILLTGPNYRAVEVLTHKLFEIVNTIPSVNCQIFKTCSRSREPVPFPSAPGSHVVAESLSLGDAAGRMRLQAAYNSSNVVFYSISAHTVPALVETLTGSSAALTGAFDLVVIDESSQVPVTLALRPLASLKPDAELVIAGDPKQMPPVQSLPPPIGAEHLVGSIHSYLISRFNLTQHPLNVNYRSADHLVDFAKTLGYDPKLKAHIKNRRLHLLAPPASVPLPTGLIATTAWQELLSPEKVVTCLIHDDPSSSQANPREALMVASLAYLLRNTASANLAPSTSHAAFTDETFIREGLGVVTPHKAQRALVISELHKLFPSVSRDAIRESVDTVERFQGGERHTIIVSFGVGDVDLIEGEEEFLLQMERANVAISRAMAKCIVMMPRTLAYHLPSDSRVTKTASAIKSYVEEFCANRSTHSYGLESLEIRWH